MSSEGLGQVYRRGFARQMVASQGDTRYARATDLRARQFSMLGNRLRKVNHNRISPELDVVQQDKESLMGEMIGELEEIRRLKAEFMQELRAYRIRQAEVRALERRHAVNQRQEFLINRAKVLSQARSFVGSAAAADAQHRARGVQLAVPYA